MAITGDTGNGATLTLSSTGGSFRIMSIKTGDQTVPVIDVSALADTGKIKKIAGDLVDGGDLECEYVWNNNPVTVSGNSASPETATLTFPTAGTLSGTGMITKFTPPELKNNQLMTAKFTFTFNGDTGPAFS